MPLAPLALKSTLINNLAAYINSRQPKADLTPGAVFRDLLIEAPAEFIYNAQVLAQFVSILQNYMDINDLLNNQTYQAQIATGLNITQDAVATIISNVLDGYAQNFAITRKNGNNASVVLTFYVKDA